MTFFDSPTFLLSTGLLSGVFLIKCFCTLGLSEAINTESITETYNDSHSFLPVDLIIVLLDVGLLRL